MFGIKDFYDDLLLEAKSPEEIKTILSHSFQNVPKDVINAIVDLDPTKKKSYSRWAVMMYENESDLLEKSINNGILKKVFDYFQERNNTGLSLSDIKSLKDAINYLPDVDPVLTKNGDGGPEDDYEIVYDTPEWKIAVPNTYPSSEKLGRGCRWCTAGAFRNGESFFNDYTRHGPLWINFDMSKGEKCPMDDKEYPYTRYQFCFETEDYRNSNDEEIESFEAIGLPEEVKDFYTEQDESYGRKIEEGAMSLEDRWEAYEEERYEHGRCLKSVEEYDNYLMLYREYDDDYRFNEDDPCYVYDDNDPNDPICYDEIDINSNYIENEFDGHNCILLRTARDSQLFCFFDHDFSHYFQALDNISDIKITDNFVIIANNKDLYMYSLSDEKIVLFNGDSRKSSINAVSITNGLKIKDSNKIFDETSMYIDILFDNDEHTLLKYDNEVKNFKAIVLYDYPFDENNGFEVSFDSNGKPHVITSEFEYGYESIDLLRDYMVYLKLNSRFCIVRKISASNYSNDKLNVFDKEKNRLVFEDDVFGILKVNENESRYLAITETHNKSYFFDLFKECKIGKDYTSIKGKQYQNGDRIIFGEIIASVRVVDLIEYEDGHLYVKASFEKVIDNFVNYKLVLVSEGPVGHRVLYDYDGNPIIKDFCTLQGAPDGFIYGIRDNTSEFLFSLAEKKYILENVKDFVNGYRYKIFYGENNNVILFTEYDSVVKKIVFCEKIISYGDNCVAYLNNNRVYFTESHFRATYPENGIDASQIAEIKSYHNYFIIKTINNNFILYKPDYKQYNVENEVFRFVDNSVSNADVEKAKEEADRLFGANNINGINEIKNSFNSFFNRISNIKF